MQAKGVIKFFLVAIIVVCVYQLLFTFVTLNYDNKAEAHAQEVVDSEMAANPQMTDDEEYELFKTEKRKFLAQMNDEVVVNLGLIKYTLRECRANQLSLGLDLKGGISMVLEVSAEDVLKNLTSNDQDAMFQQAMADASEAQKSSTKDYLTLFREAWESNNPDAKMATVFAKYDEFGGDIEYTSTNDEVMKRLREAVEGSIDNTFRKIKLRIDQFGVANPNINKEEGTGRIIVELPGVDDPERVRKILQSTANLEFWYTYDVAEVGNYFITANETLRGILSMEEGLEASDNEGLGADDGAMLDGGSLTLDENDDTTAEEGNPLIADGDEAPDTNSLSDLAGGDTEANTDSIEAAANTDFNPLIDVLGLNVITNDGGQQMWNQGPVIGFALAQDTAKVNRYLAYDEVRSAFPRDLKLLWSAKAIDGDNKEKIFQLYAIKTEGAQSAPLNGDVIKDASPTYDNQGLAAVSMNMNSFGADKWEKMTASSIGKSIAIVLDNRVFSAPVVQVEISSGRSIIEGMDSYIEATDLANVLKAGKLDAPAKIIEEEIVGPSLGAESVNSGLISLVVGFLLVIIFMIVYYGKGGIVSDIALFLNLFIIVGSLASLGAALTLPGIAGLVLTIGMAVDANVIIFERIREELDKGKGSRLALTDGFKHSYSAIIDANITTMIVALILLTFGLGPVKGFAVVLAIGIVSSVFTAVLVARVLFDDIYLKRDKTVSFSTSLSGRLFKGLNYPFLSKRKISYAVSGIIIAIGLVSIFTTGFQLGVDFKGGRSYVVNFDQAVNTTELAQNLDAIYDDVPVVKTYGTDSRVNITTSHLIDDASEEADSLVRYMLFEGVKGNFIDAPTFEGFINTSIEQQTKVDATIADDISKGSIRIAIIASLAIFLYILFRFRKWQYGLGALAALVHDVLIILSLFSLLKTIMPFSMEINQALIAALLTVIGYSINDTVVVFDRIREFLNLHPTTDLKTNVDNAVNTTLSRTIITSLTTMLVVVILFLFGGESIRGFSFALFIGIIVGTYSSVFIATPVAVDLLSRKAKS